ncbi:hypothetical protein G9A89_001795 [Geosiphon pyriformis]|nr:hypothetical protein G9A89_001795 [Geosiphon pyriformis]
MSMKKSPKSAFHGSVGVKSDISEDMYSNMDSEFSNNETGRSVVGSNGGFLLGLAAFTSKAKKSNIGLISSTPVEVEVLVKKFFTLDINLLAVDGKLVTAKTQFIRKLFSLVNEKNIEITTSLAREKGIDVNSNLKKQEIHSNWAVVIKKILMNTPKKMIITALAEFGEIKSIKTMVKFTKSDQTELLAARWSFLIASRDWFRVLLFTLSMGITAHNLDTLLDKIVGFESEECLESAYQTEPIFGGVKLFWARLDLVCCENCGHFNHSAIECNATIAPNAKSLRFIKKVTSDVHHLQLVKLYTKKNVPIFCSAAFGGKFWAQIISIASPFGGSHFGSGSGAGFSSLGVVCDKGDTLADHDSSSINNYLALLECFLELLADQVSDVLHKLNSMELVLLVLVLKVEHPDVFIFVLSISDADMILDILWPSLLPSSPKIEEKTVDLDLSSSKVLTSKVGELEFKMIALEVSIDLILGKLDLLCDLGNMISIVTKTKLRSDIRPWIMGKFDGVWIFTTGLDLSVIILGLYTGVSVGTHFGQAAVINSMIFKAVNSSSFSNSKGVKRVIDFILVSGNLVSAIALHKVNDVFEFFNSDHKSVSVLIGLGGLLDVYFISIHKQDHVSAELLVRSDMFEEAENNDDLNTMWKMLEEAIVQAANTVFSKIWYGECDCLKNKQSLKFFKLEQLIAKILKYWNSSNLLNFNCLIKIDSIILTGVSSVKLVKHLSVIRKKYWKSKYCESKIAKDTAIRKVIDCYMENFCFDKGRIIKSILKHPFCKVVLNYLVVDNELVVEPKEKGGQENNLFFQKCLTFDYVNDNAFSGIMDVISMVELSLVVDNLPNNKAVGLSGIPNKL